MWKNIPYVLVGINNFESYGYVIQITNSQGILKKSK